MPAVRFPAVRRLRRAARARRVALPGWPAASTHRCAARRAPSSAASICLRACSVCCCEKSRPLSLFCRRWAAPTSFRPYHQRQAAQVAAEATSERERNRDRQMPPWRMSMVGDFGARLPNLRQPLGQARDDRAIQHMILAAAAGDLEGAEAVAEAGAALQRPVALEAVQQGARERRRRSRSGRRPRSP